jgi:diadenylate cyclase
MTTKDEVKTLWKLCFNDSDEFTDLYFKMRYKDEVNRVIREDGKIISALQMIPYPMTFCDEVISTSYISGACTHPDYRKHGAMKRLLKETHRCMYEDGVLLASLIPAEEWLFGYYARSGYAPVFGYAVEQVRVDRLRPAPGCQIEVCEFPGVEHYHYFDSRMHGRRSCIQHPKEDFLVIMADLRLGNGKLLVAYLLYQTYRLMKDSGSINIFIGILVFIGIWLIVSQVLEMKLLGSIFDKLVSVGVLALIILFQDDIRRFLVTLGSHKQLGRFFRFLTGNKQEKTEKADIMPIVLACMSMSKGKVGALIVIEKSVPLNDIIRTGEIINANVNQRLIENIFFKNSPLHDGAMIIRHKRIEAAGCILPVSHDLNIPKELGLRHRAAMGVSQETDALAIIVSEETGGISVAYKGQFHLRLTAEELERILTKED